jgi:hypothetical protein
VSTRKNDVVCCPIKGCHSQLIATHPMKTEIRFDRVMQNLVDKLLPKFTQQEDELKSNIAREYGRADPSLKRASSAGTTAAGDTPEPAAKRQKFGDEKLYVDETPACESGWMETCCVNDTHCALACFRCLCRAVVTRS